MRVLVPHDNHEVFFLNMPILCRILQIASIKFIYVCTYDIQQTNATQTYQNWKYSSIDPYLLLPIYHMYKKGIIINTQKIHEQYYKLYGHLRVLLFTRPVSVKVPSSRYNVHVCHTACNNCARCVM